MITDALRILIRDHFISRLWNWIVGYGILIAMLGVTVVYEHSGVLNPLRYLVSQKALHWISIGVYALSVAGVALSFLLRYRSGAEKLAKEADKASLNPGAPIAAEGFSEVEQRAQIILWRLSRVESFQLNAASWPGFLGILWYMLVGTTRSLSIYMAISMVTMLFHCPSLYHTEQLVEDYIRRRSVPFVERDFS